MKELLRPCSFCGEPVNALDPWVWHRVIGWERRGQQGGSDITLREKRDEYAHHSCVDQEKSKQVRGQGSLLGDAA